MSVIFRNQTRFKVEVATGTSSPVGVRFLGMDAWSELADENLTIPVAKAFAAAINEQEAIACHFSNENENAIFTIMTTEPAEEQTDPRLTPRPKGVPNGGESEAGSPFDLPTNPTT